MKSTRTSFLNFLVNSLDEEVALSLAENAELDAEDIYEVLVGACADGTSVSTLCERSEDAPHENSAFSTISALNSICKRSNRLEHAPPERRSRRPSQQVEVCADLHLRPYYGDEDDTDGLYHSQAKRGTTAFHAYATLYARVKNNVTLAVRRLEDGDTASSVLAEFLGILDGLDLGVKAVYLDREFYDSKCLTLLQAHNHAYVMPIVRWGRTIKRELSEGWSRVIQHSLTSETRRSQLAVEFPVYIDCTYQNGRYDEHGVARHGYAADAPFIDSPRDARYHYAKRFGIEASYRLSEQSIATTSTQNPVVRLLYVVVSLLLQNVWRYLHWEYVATPRRGGASPLGVVVQGVHQYGPSSSVDGLAVRRAVPANRPPDDRFHR
jgi:IS4 transposase